MAPIQGGVVTSTDVNPRGRLFFGTTLHRTWAADPADGALPNNAFAPALSVGGDFTGVGGNARRGYARFIF